ncbi:hypothetical protein [Allokutzneria sp. NRRL B-24872]|uniref:hypothetical protein n=1 Tax=Allokutzneria sp. NRRL B-24872 TaxID=1137961 RepID=UPI000A36E519|nr:hypothetical protein [Allokutzneria sp. NRRL B-24872]
MTEQQRLPRPKTVEFAFRLSVVSALSAFVSLAYYFAQREDVVAMLSHVVRRFDFVPSERQEAYVQDMVNNAMTMSVVVTVILAGVLVTFAILMRQRKNWARIVLTVVLVFGLAGMQATVNGVALSAPGFLALFVFAVNIAVIVLLYVPASNRYFAKPELQG